MGCTALQRSSPRSWCVGLSGSGPLQVPLSLCLFLLAENTQGITGISSQKTAVRSREREIDPRLTSTSTGVACDFMLTPLGCVLFFATARGGSTRLLVEVRTPTLATKASLRQPPPDKATAAKNGSFIFAAVLLRARARLLCLGCVFF